MIWVGWIGCHGFWDRVCEAESQSVAFQELVKIQKQRGCRKSLHGVLTGGAPPAVKIKEKCR